MGLINAWSIVNKTALIHDAIADHNLDLLAVTETFVYENSPDVHKLDAAPSGYSILHQHRLQKSGPGSTRGGGIAIIHRDDIKVKMEKVDPARHKSFELMLVKLMHSKKGMKMAVIYRPPSSSIPDFVAEVADLLESGDLGNRYIICGDLNCPGPANTRGRIHEDLMKLIDEQSLRQHVHEATCRTGNILDHILTPESATIVNSVKITDIGLSDHSLVSCRLVDEIPRAPIATAVYRSWKQLDVDCFRQKIMSSSLYQKPADTVNAFAAQLESVVSEILNELVPVKKITRRAGESKLISGCQRRQYRQNRGDDNLNDDGKQRVSRQCAFSTERLVDSQTNG